MRTLRAFLVRLGGLFRSWQSQASAGFGARPPLSFRRAIQ
jgi:hypothetical protein